MTHTHTKPKKPRAPCPMCSVYERGANATQREITRLRALVEKLEAEVQSERQSRYYADRERIQRGAYR